MKSNLLIVLFISFLLAGCVTTTTDGKRIDSSKTDSITNRAMMNIEYLKLYLNPGYLLRSRFLRRRRIGSLSSLARVSLNTLDHIPSMFNNQLFLSRGSV